MVILMFTCNNNDVNVVTLKHFNRACAVYALYHKINLFTRRTSGKIILRSILHYKTTNTNAAVTFNILKHGEYLDIDHNVVIFDAPTHIGNIDYEGPFTDFDYKKFDNPFNQRYKEPTGTNVSHDITARFDDAGVQVSEKALLQFTNDNADMRTAVIVHNFKTWMVFAETSKFGIFTRETLDNILIEKVALRGTDPVKARVTFNIYKLDNFVSTTEKPPIRINNKPTHFGTRYKFPLFKSNDANQLGNPFNQRYTPYAQKNAEVDVTTFFSSVCAGERVLLQFTSANKGLRVIHVIHDGIECAA